jgi:tetraacyldisaccharide 4'-kinase
VLNPDRFRDLVSGQSRGPRASLARIGLRLASIPYGWAIRLRNAYYDHRTAKIHRLPVPVICVGNLTLGGTGKTPMVAWLARWFRQQNVRVAIISRGYGAAAGSRNDEALELEEQLPDVPHLQNPDRVVAGQVAVDELDSELIILDDGFQHRRLHRDLDIVLIDGLAPFGHGYLFPRGFLREPVSGLRRAAAVVLTRSDMVSDERRIEIRRRIGKVAPAAYWIEMVHEPYELRDAAANSESLEVLAGADVAAFSGIGNPAGFDHTLTVCGYRVAGRRIFPDHHGYSADDIRQLGDWIQELDVTAAVCTHKDLVKIGLRELGGKPLWAVCVEMKPRSPIAALEEMLRAVY